jgi:hypothetical protein
MASSAQNAKLSNFHRKSAEKCKPVVLGEYLLNMTSVFESVIVEKISQNSLACKTIKL